MGIRGETSTMLPRLEMVAFVARRSAKSMAMRESEMTV